MSAGAWFWIVFVVALIVWMFLSWPFAADTRRTSLAMVVVFVLIALLGWATIGPPIR